MIQNYLSKYFYHIINESEIKKSNVFLIKNKYTKTNSLSLLKDIKDGLLKMVIFSNLSDVKLNNREFEYRAVLNLYNNKNKQPSHREKEIIERLKEEGRVNNFDIWINGNKII